MKRIVKYSVETEKVESCFFSPTLWVWGFFTAIVSPPLPTAAGPYPDVVRRRGRPAHGGGRERGWAALLHWGSATALGTALLPYAHAATGVRGMVPGTLKHRSVRGR